jgi:hypothetical protein
MTIPGPIRRIVYVDTRVLRRRSVHGDLSVLAKLGSSFVLFSIGNSSSAAHNWCLIDLDPSALNQPCIIRMLK